MPIDLKGVAFVNVGVTFERKEIQVVMNDLLGLLNHLQFGNPKSGLSNSNGEVVNFDAIELPDRNFDGS